MSGVRLESGEELSLKSQVLVLEGAAPAEDTAAAPNTESAPITKETTTTRTEPGGAAEESAISRTKSGAPAEEAAMSSAESEAPAEETAVSSAESEAPAEEVTASSTESEAPAEEVAASSTESGAPAEESESSGMDQSQAQIMKEMMAAGFLHVEMPEDPPVVTAKSGPASDTEAANLLKSNAKAEAEAVEANTQNGAEGDLEERSCAICMTNHGLKEHRCQQCTVEAWQVCAVCDDKLACGRCPICRAEYAAPVREWDDLVRVPPCLSLSLSFQNSVIVFSSYLSEPSRLIILTVRKPL